MGKKGKNTAKKKAARQEAKAAEKTAEMKTDQRGAYAASVKTCGEVGEELSQEMRDTLTIASPSQDDGASKHNKQVVEGEEKNGSYSDDESEAGSSEYVSDDASDDSIVISIDLDAHGLEGDCPLCFESLPPVLGLGFALFVYFGAKKIPAN